MLIVFSQASCNQTKETENKIIQKDILSTCNMAIQNAIVVDRVAAPVGSRRYVYASIAAYESLVPFYNEYNSVSTMMNGLKQGSRNSTYRKRLIEKGVLFIFTNLV